MLLSIPLPVRLAVLFALGAFVGGLVNWGTYRLAWHRRWISPWSAPPEGIARRKWTDRVPVIGWLTMAREGTWHGRRFWIRPMLVEIGTGALFAGLYLWDTQWNTRWVLQLAAAPPPDDFLTSNLVLAEHMRYLSHVLVVALMLVASLIDVDEKIIPDTVTVPGTLAGLLLAVVYPWSLPPADRWPLAGGGAVEFLTLTSPAPWPDSLRGLPAASGILVALGCWTLWCGGLMPRLWNTRRGWTIASRVFFRRLVRAPITYWLLALWLIGAALLTAAARGAPAAHWAGLLSALVGMAAGGGIVWIVRIVGSAALAREAMGFGDVTLMSMIGAFVGWQAALIIFFLAPFAGLVIGVAQWIARGDREIPYGPFLCLAALVVIFCWGTLWIRTAPYFEMGWLLPAVIAASMGLLGGLLYLYRTLHGGANR